MKTNAVKTRLDKARTELERFCGAGGHQLNATRALQECYRQIAMAAVDASTPEDRMDVDVFLGEVDKRVGY